MLYCFTILAYSLSQVAWGDAQIERLLDWGFNTLAAGHSSWLEHNGLAHTVQNYKMLYIYLLGDALSWNKFR